MSNIGRSLTGKIILHFKEKYMPLGLTITLIILLVLVGALIALYFFGRKLQSRQAEQQEAIEAAKQIATILVIDKKRLKIKESGLPSIVYEQTPWYMRRTKLPIVKAKIQNRIVTLVADEKAYQVLPTKTEAKVVISGIYITEVKSARGGLLTPSPKKNFFQRIFSKKK